MAETVALIDYGSGNLRSAEKALVHAAQTAGLKRRILVTDNPDQVAAADRVVLPGVGAFADCYQGLAAIDGLIDVLHGVRDADRPLLGICVGMQLLAREGFEHGRHKGFGWIDAVVGPLKTDDPALKIPHMGWNTLAMTQAGAIHPMLKGIQAGDHAYFVHSYHMACQTHGLCLAHTDYGGPVVAMVANRAVVGTQFHPEKSQQLGQKILTNFLQWQP